MRWGKGGGREQHVIVETNDVADLRCVQVSFLRLVFACLFESDVMDVHHARGLICLRMEKRCVCGFGLSSSVSLVIIEVK